ncbi:31428_t:CDS:1 [Gigaspora margarita]|uniref:31428_t:CDS:1 n=1 Tax=Gigaspora margarita TaxID=4874 RepID=A0ABN7VAT5_GIGMA|nr:31428_t:CDS:1 [Gigaspora margarita]
MDRPLEPVNHDDTLVSPSADINEHDLDYVVIPEISLRKRKLYTNDTSREVGDDVSELSSKEIVPTDSNYSGPSKKFSNKKNKKKEKATVSAAVSHSQLQRQPPDPFRNCELKTASGTKNAFDLIHSQKQKNTRITDHNDAPNVSVESSNAITKKKASGFSIRSPA